MEKLNWKDWEESCKALMHEYDVVYQRAKEMNELFKHKGIYILVSVSDDAKTIFKQEFNNISDAVKEIEFNNKFGFKSYLKYSLSISIKFLDSMRAVLDIMRGNNDDKNI